MEKILDESLRTERHREAVRRFFLIQEEGIENSHY